MIFTDNSEKTLESIRLQYKKDLFHKLGVKFQKSKKLLDVGCGNGADGTYLKKMYKIFYSGTDIYKDKAYPKNFPFKKASILELPYKSASFDYIFVHDVLHHVDEPKQRGKILKDALKELKRVCKKNGQIIICEGNRYNPISYTHIVKTLGHDHFSSARFEKLVQSVFKDRVTFKQFELHAYPPSLETFYRLFEFIMDHLPGQFRSYNVAIIENI